MDKIEIASFRMVILCEMQRLNVGFMTFSEAWRACERANDALPTSTHLSDRKLFVWRLHEALRILQEDGWLSFTYEGPPPQPGHKLLKVTLTEEGADRLRATIFTHQDRMGDRP